MFASRSHVSSLLIALTLFGGAALGVTAFAGAASAASPELDTQSSCIGAHGELTLQVRNTSSAASTLTVTSTPDLVDHAETLAAGALSAPFVVDDVPDGAYTLTVTSTDPTSTPASSPVTVACAADESNATAVLDATRDCHTGDITGSVDVAGVRSSAGDGAVPFHGVLDVFFDNAVIGHATLIGGSANIPITAHLDPAQTVFATSIETPASDDNDISFNGTFVLPACAPSSPASSITPTHTSSAPSTSSAPTHASSAPTSSATSAAGLAETGAKVGTQFAIAAALLLLGGLALAFARRIPRRH